MERPERRTRSLASTLPVLLGLGAAGLAVFVLVSPGEREARRRQAPLASATPEHARDALSAGSDRERTLRADARRELEPSEPSGAVPAAAEPRGEPVDERDFLARWRALARERPGALEERAREVLDGPSPDAGKVALLRALVESGSPERAHWLTHAARTLPDRPTAQGRSVASYALASLAREAARDDGARACLRALAFDERELALPLRRTAVAAYARVCADHELAALRQALLGEPDELFVAGAAASLAEREDSPPLASIRQDFPLAPDPPDGAERGGG